MPAVRYEFVAIGADQIKAAFRGITAEAQASTRAAAQSQAAATRATRTTGGDKAASDKAKALAHVARIRDKHFADEQRAAEAAEKRIAAAQARIHDKALRDRERAERAARRNREIGEQTTQRAIERAELRARQERTKFRADLGGAAFRGAGGVAAAAGTVAFGATIAATRDAMRVQELANRVSINARKKGEAFIDPNVLRREWEQTAAATPGQTAEGIGGAVQKYITMTGDIGTARRGQGTFATVASATGADVGDIAEVAASLSQHFDVKGLEEMRDVLAALTFQGKEGAFELKDAAAMYQRLAASAAAFGVEKSGKGVKMLGGLTQIARTGTGSAEQAATAIENMFTQFKFKAPKIKAAGVDVYKGGKVRPIEELIPEVISKVGGTDIAKKQAGLTQIFGEQGIRAINPLVAKYNETFQGTKGTDAQKTAAAMARVSEEINKAANAAGTWQDVVIDAGKAQENASAKFTAAWERFVAVVGDEVLPALTPLVGDLTDFKGVLGDGITEFGLFLRGLRELLEFLNIIKPKSPEERLAENRQKLKELDAAAEGITTVPTKEESEKRERLVRLIEQDVAASQFKVGTGVKDFDEFSAKLKAEGGTFAGSDASEAKAFYDLATTNPAAARERLEAGEYKSFTAEGKTTAMALTGQVDAATGGVTDAPEQTGAVKAADAFGKVVGALSDLSTPIGMLKIAIEAAASANKADLLGGNGPK